MGMGALRQQDFALNTMVPDASREHRQRRIAIDAPARCGQVTDAIDDRFAGGGLLERPLEMLDRQKPRPATAFGKLGIDEGDHSCRVAQDRHGNDQRNALGPQTKARGADQVAHRDTNPKNSLSEDDITEFE
jgi:hypothetical protein